MVQAIAAMLQTLKERERGGGGRERKKRWGGVT